jgi:hypothetical protein
LFQEKAVKLILSVSLEFHCHSKVDRQHHHHQPDAFRHRHHQLQLKQLLEQLLQR